MAFKPPPRKPHMSGNSRAPVTSSPSGPRRDASTASFRSERGNRSGGSPALWGLPWPRHGADLQGAQNPTSAVRARELAIGSLWLRSIRPSGSPCYRPVPATGEEVPATGEEREKHLFFQQVWQRVAGSGQGVPGAQLPCSHPMAAPNVPLACRLTDRQ
jgi:hypothetical protein